MKHVLLKASRRGAKATTLTALFILVLLALSNATHAQQTARMTTGGIGYLEYLPPDYASNPTKKYPLLIFLHGLGETGNGSPADLQKVKANGPPKLIQNGSTMCFTVNGVQECFIVLSPQLASTQGGWWPNTLTPFFDYVMDGPQGYRIDKSRVYLTGLSLGGWGVYVGLAETKDIFAAGGVVCGFSNGQACSIATRKIPVWGFHGESDGTIPYSTGLNEFNKTGQCTPKTTAELKWSNYPGVGHNAWDNAYRTDHVVHNPNLYEWLLSKKKGMTGNVSPSANAGTDKTMTLPTNTASLSGSGSDADGSVSSYAWTKVSGGAATLANASTSTLALSGLVSGSYVFRLTVTDNAGATGSDDVSVTVNASSNAAPVANAGTDKSITLPTNSLTLTGSATDANGTIATYSWSKVSGGAANLSNVVTPTVSLSGLVQGSYVFRLTVTDNAGATASDDVSVTVNGSSNVAPVVNAGTDKSITLPTTSLDITGSATDADGTITRYSWSQVSGSTATIINVVTPTVAVSGLVQGTYVFRLTVTDNAGATASDDVSVTVNASGNAAPVANAGTDKSITLPTNSLSLTGTATDANGTIATYSWSKVSGGAASLTNAVTSTVSLSGLVQGTYVFRLTVTDNAGATASDDVSVTVNGATNAAPIANAGTDKSITLPTTSLDITGSATDADGTITRYSWSQVSGSIATIINVVTPTVSVSGLVQGTYVFRLTATDNSGATASDDVSVTVNGSGNVPPVVNAGADRTITLPTTSIDLTGSATDANGTITRYSWSQVSGGVVTLVNVVTSTVSISALVPGSYVFRLTATDNSGATASDDVTVTVNNAVTLPTGSNLALLKPAVTSSDEGWAMPGALAFDGLMTTRWGSKFTDAQWIYVDLGATYNITSVKITWQFASASSFKIQVSADANTWTDIKSITNNTVFTNDLTGLSGSGRYVRMLGITRSTTYGYSINEFEVYGNATAGRPAAPNTPPVVNVGADKTITLPTNTVTISSTATDADGVIISYAWTKVSGGAATLSNTGTTTLSVAGLTAGTYVFRLLVTDNTTAPASDEVTVTVNAAPVVPAPIINLALMKPAVTSSDEGWAMPGSLAVDGDASTRWGSKFTDPQWLYVDLGSLATITGVKVVWQVASASSYKIQVSNDAVTWTDIKSVTNNTTLTNDLTGLSGAGRYVRMYGITRATAYGYSIFEFEVYGSLQAVRTTIAIDDTTSKDLETAFTEIEEEFVFLDRHYPGAKDYSVAIFNSNGNEIYRGEWEKELFNTVFTEKGLYFYHVFKSRTQVDSGKLLYQGF